MSFVSSITVDQGSVTGLTLRDLVDSDLPVALLTPGEYFLPKLRADQYGRIISIASGYNLGPTQTLTDAATITFDPQGLTNGSVTLTGSTTRVLAFTDILDGGFYALKVIQGSGNDLLTYASPVDWGAAGAPTLSTAAGLLDILYFSSDGSKVYGFYYLGYTAPTAVPANGIVDEHGNYFVDNLGNYWVWG